MMRLYLVEPIPGGRWSPYYDNAEGFVVRASTAAAARQLAAKQAGDEGLEPWLSPEKTRCRALRHDGRPGVILRAFNAG